MVGSPLHTHNLSRFHIGIFQQTEDCEVGSRHVQVHLIFKYIHYVTDHRCTYARHQLTWVTKCCVVVHNISGSSEWNLLHITCLAPRFWNRSEIFWKFVDPSYQHHSI